MSSQRWRETVYWLNAAAAAVANTTSESLIIPKFTIPANTMNSGRCLELRAFGKYSTSGTPTVSFAVRYGGLSGTLIAQTALITLPSSVTNACWSVDLMIQTYLEGSSGTVMANGEARVHSAVAPTVGSTTGAPALTPFTAGGVTAPAAVSVDWTVGSDLVLTWTWGTASSSNTATGLNGLLDIDN